MASASPKTKASPTPKTTSSPATNTTTEPNKARAIPFHGKISGVDQKAKTFALASKEHPRLLKITDKTTMTKAGKPFVGPAGKILDRALEEAGIDRMKVYVTNTVKHFKWEPRGKRRIHKKPNSREIAACRPWLEAELRAVNPGLLVCMGATAAQAVFGPKFRVTRERGKVLESELAPKVVATVHPSSLLRQPDEESREREYKLFVADLRTALKAAK